MTQKYQNEKSPILNGQKKPRTWGKVQKIRDLECVGLFHPFENTLLFNYFPRQNSTYVMSGWVTAPPPVDEALCLAVGTMGTSYGLSLPGRQRCKFFVIFLPTLPCPSPTVCWGRWGIEASTHRGQEPGVWYWYHPSHNSHILSGLRRTCNRMQAD